MKLRSIRGPNWVEISVSATITIENTTPTTVMIAAAMVVRICLAASGEPLSAQDGIPETAVKRSPVQRVGDREQHQRATTSSSGHEPQVGAQFLAQRRTVEPAPSPHDAPPA